MTAIEQLQYSVDSDTGVLIKHTFDPKSFQYADTAEESLLNLFRGATDLSTGSQEIQRAIKDWPTEYHLSLARSNLLRGFDLSRFTSVLEIGCGCGAITRQLGEQGLSVTALDGSFQRAAVTRARCRDLPKVKVVCENFESFEDSKRYDLVTLIGVLEYAPAFITSESPFEDMLRRARSFLKPDGVLVIAIENLLGLKYFAGHEEDHVGKPYWGIQGLYQPSAARTLGRVQMDQLLEGVGFTSRSYYYPFPDYKIPEVIVSEGGVRHPTFKPTDVVAAQDARSYNGGVNLPFDEGLVWESICANELVPHMANSFLIFSSQQGAQALAPEAWLAKKFSISQSDTSVVTTTFVEQGPGDVRVYKSRSGLASSSPSTLQSEEGYVSGQNLLFVVRRAMAANLSLEEVAETLNPWVELLVSSRSNASGEWIEWKLPKTFFDCVPHNVLIQEGKGCFIDRQDSPWQDEHLDFSWVVVRGVLLTLAKSCHLGCLEHMKVRDAVRALCACLGFEVTEMTLQRCLEHEEIALFGLPRSSGRPFFLKSFVEGTLQNRVNHFHRLFLDQQEAYCDLKRERDSLPLRHQQKIEALAEAHVEVQILKGQIARKHSELSELRAELYKPRPSLISRIVRRGLRILTRA